MPGETVPIKFYGAATTSTDAVAQIDVPDDGLLIGVLASHYMAATLANGIACSWELSFASASGFTSNDTRASFFRISNTALLLTSGAAQGSVNQYMGPIALPIQAGERIYAHTLVAGTVTTNFLTAYLYFQLGRSLRLATGRPSRRRRAS